MSEECECTAKSAIRAIANELLIRNQDKLTSEEIKSLEDIKDANEFLIKVIEKVTSRESLDLLRHLCVLEDGIDRDLLEGVYGNVYENIKDLLDELISANILEAHGSKLVFAFDQIKEELKEDKEDYHRIAVQYYEKKMEREGKSSDDQIKLISHCLKAGDTKRALEIFLELSSEATGRVDKIIEIGEELLKVADYEDKGKVLRNLGNLCFDSRKAKEAEKYYLEAIGIYIELSKKNQEYMPDLAKLLNNIANLYSLLKKYDEAEENYQWAARLFRDLDMLPELAITLDNLGILYIDIDKLEEAENTLKEAFAIRKELAKSDPSQLQSLAMTLNNLGVLYRKMKKFDRVEECYNYVLKIFKELAEKSEENIVHLAATLNNLGALYIETDRVEEGLKYIGEALEYEAMLPPDLKIKCYLLAGKGLEKLGDTERAAELYMKAASLSFTMFRQYGYRSINFIHYLEKVQEIASGELKGDAILMKNAIMKLYYKRDVDFPEVECSKRGQIILKAARGMDVGDFYTGSEEDLAAYILAMDLLALPGK